MNPKITAKDYLKIVEWSDEDNCFIGSAPPLVDQCCHGNDEAKVYKELCQIVDEYIEIYRRDGRPLPEPTAHKNYSGRFVVRIKPEIHRALSIRALAAGDSLNSYVQRALTAAV